MKNSTNTPASPGVSLADAEEIIRRQRKAHGKPTRSKPRAVDLVLNNEQVIRHLRDAGYKQEDAVLLLFELGGENHKPDTLRKAIAKVLGPWSNQGDHNAEKGSVLAPHEEIPPVSGTAESREVLANSETNGAISEGDYL